MKATQQEQDQIQALARQIAEKEGLRLERKVVLKSDLPDDMVVRQKSKEIEIKATLPPAKLADCIESGIKAADEIDSERARLRKGAIVEAKKEAKYWIGFLMRHLDPHDFQLFIEQVVGLGENHSFRLEE